MPKRQIKRKLKAILHILTHRSWAPDDDRWYLPAAGPSHTGVEVTEEVALSASAIFAGVRILSETLGQLPLHLCRRLPGERSAKARAVEHPLYSVLHDQPNPLQSAFEFKEFLTANMIVRGNGYAEIERDNSGAIKWLWPLPANRVEMVREGTQFLYLFRPLDGTKKVIPWKNMFHIRGFALDGLMGLVLPEVQKEPIGRMVAVEEHGARWFANGAVPGGVLETPQALDPESRKNLKETWEDAHRGLSNTHRIAVLEQDLKYKQRGVSAEDAQLLESRTFEITEAARALNLPPHILRDLSRATFSNIEHQGIELRTYSFGPYLARWEGRVKVDLLTESEREQYFAEFLAAALERTDIKTRYMAYQIGRYGGWLSANDVRALENMNPREDPGGDAYWMPSNMQEETEEEEIKEDKDKDDEASPGNGNGRSATVRVACAPYNRLHADISAAILNSE